MTTPIRSVLSCAALALIACTPEREILRLEVGETCEAAGDCHSGHCELAADAPARNPDQRVCCQVSCTDGSRCDGRYCRPSCVGQSCPQAQSQLGMSCEWSAECESGFCEPDDFGELQCCDDDCSALGLSCIFGECGCPFGSAPSDNGVCESTAAIDDDFSSLPDPATGDDAMALLAPDGGPNGPRALPLQGEGDLEGADGGRCSPDCDSPESSCGDRYTDLGEECDGQLSCTSECLTAACGNGRLDPGEECEPPGTAACSEHCLVLGCGNGRLDPNEECDPPLVGGCDERCLIPQCGNDRLDTGEECEPPDPGRCDSKCRKVTCNNKRVEETEGCDPPLPGVCSDDCRPLGCGDGIKDAGEECDPPEYGSCSGSCLEIICGNKRFDEGEECDPPAEGTCSEACQKIECGNHRIDEGEECDPPIAGECGSDCQRIECGNQRIDEGETCEPVATNDVDCSRYCTVIEAGTTYLYGFGTSSEGWRPSAAAPDSLLTESEVLHSPEGESIPGSSRLVVPFDGPAQKLELAVRRKAPVDATGLVLIARVRLQAGLAGDGDAGAVRLFAKSGAHADYVSGPWVELLPTNEWVSVVLDPANPALQPDDFNAEDVREIGLELATFAGSEQVTEAIFELDSVALTAP